MSLRMVWCVLELRTGVPVPVRGPIGAVPGPGGISSSEGPGLFALLQIVKILAQCG